MPQSPIDKPTKRKCVPIRERATNPMPSGLGGVKRNLTRTRPREPKVAANRRKLALKRLGVDLVELRPSS